MGNLGWYCNVIQEKNIWKFQKKTEPDHNENYDTSCPLVYRSNF